MKHPYLLILALVFGQCTSALSQGLLPSELDRIEKTPTNTWQQQAKPSKPVPSLEVDRLNRSARDAYADKAWGVGMPIEELIQKHLGYNNRPPRLPSGNSGIVQPMPNEFVVVGTFDSFDEILTPTHQAIYCELHFGVSRTIFPSDFAMTGGMIDLFEPGGSILLKDGQSLSFRNAARNYGLVPHQRYILFLRHIEEGDFYLVGDSIVIENGVAKPNSPDAVNASRAGKWPFLLLKEADLVNKLSEQLSLQQPQQ